MRPFSIILFGEALVRFCATLFVVIIPRARPIRRPPLSIVLVRIDGNPVPRPKAEPGLQPVFGRFGAISGDRFAQHRSARLALLRGTGIEPLDVFIG